MGTNSGIRYDPPLMAQKRFPVPEWRPPEGHGRRRARFPRGLEYLLFRCLETAILSLPYRRAVILSRLLARIAHVADRKHRKTARRNLAAAFPDWSPAKVRAVTRRMYEHFALVLVELFFTRRRVRPSTFRRYATFAGWEGIQRVLAEGRGLVIVVGHLGNWEFAAYASALNGLPVTSIARPLDNRRINDHLLGLRVATGQEIVYKYDALRRMIASLRENRALVIPSDQNVRGEAGIFVPFFGRDASTIRSTALLCRKYGIPYTVATHVRTDPDRFHYRIEFSPPTDPARFEGTKDPLREITADFTGQLERYIRERPEQYLWMHKRWKTRPAGERPDAAADAGAPVVTSKRP